MKAINLIHGDCIEKMKELETNSVDSIVTDPPYQIGFMGKSWDASSITYNIRVWIECLRVLKPGGHLLSFSGTKTYHKMVTVIEDVGFEIRDMIEWVYGSGFPKSLNIGKAVDKLQGNEREVVGTVRGVRGADGTGHENAMPGKATGVKQVSIDLPLTKGTSEWEGWGTALKPAHEPICLARKPLSEKTVALNVLKWGTGGINIDESRVGTEQTVTRGRSKGGTYELGLNNPDFTQTNTGRFPANLIYDNSEEVRECFPETKSGKLKSDCYEKDRENDSMFAGGENFTHKGYEADSGNASRFFKSILYYPKASKSERNRGCENLEFNKQAILGINKICNYCGLTQRHAYEKENIGKCEHVWEHPIKKNTHPTVKPIALMEYLIKMITPKNGVVLDPFMGSGSTGIACKQNGFNFIGIEKEEEYFKIAKARIEKDWWRL